MMGHFPSGRAFPWAGQQSYGQRQAAYPQWRAAAPATLGGVLPGRYKNEGQPMTKSSQVCRKFLAGAYTYGAKCIYGQPPTATMPPSKK